MKATYDKHYLEENLFGEPYKGLVEFFKEYEPKGKVLDLGCGQGRDALALARLGYQVHGVDISEVGLKQMKKKNKKDKLGITTSCTDIYTMKISKDFDILLLDSMFHFYQPDMEVELGFLKKVLLESREDAVLAIYIQKGKRRERILKDNITALVEFDTLSEKYIAYESYSNAEYLMLVIQKTAVKPEKIEEVISEV